MPFATAAEAIEFIDRAITRAPDTYHLLPQRLRHIARYPYMQRLMAELGHPEAGLRVAHVAGTSGKGSTATMISAIARAAGVHAGLYTSPYLTVPQERIQIDGTFIADDLFASCVSDVAVAIERFKGRFPDFEPHLKMIWVAATLLAFARAKVDLAVIEVGMGGRYDETNIVQPASSTVVSIGLDHMVSLGDTLPEIAFHKAGIIKSGAPAISGVTEPAPRAIIEAQARLAGVPIATIGEEFAYDGVHLTRAGTCFSYHDSGGDIPDCQVGLIGRHYAHNASLAIRTARALFPTIGDEAIRAGLCQAWLPGRFEMIGHDPLIILDVAHNPDKLRALVETVLALFPEKPVWPVIGTMEDKDSAQMLDILRLLHPVRVICTEVSMKHRPVTSADALAARAAEIGLAGEVVREPQMAVRHAIQLAGNDGLVIVTGSLFLVSQVRPMVVS
jgi:dihydrofolate synthase / folylpolyglutamate synthase